MNHIIWHLGFYDKDSELAQSVKTACSHIHCHNEYDDNWLFLNDENAAKTADKYAEKVVDYIFVKLGLKDSHNGLTQLEKNEKRTALDWFNENIFSGVTSKGDKSKMEERLRLLIRGHYLELKGNTWFDKLMKKQNLDHDISDILKKVFNYKYFSSTEKKYRSELLSATKITICPYCDRQYISYYSEDKTTADLDHFWDKSKYPYFALSLFNFIPSCHTCNSTFKGTKNLKVYPYRNGFENKTHFELEPGNKINRRTFFAQVVIGSYKGRINVKQCVNEDVPKGRKADIENDISALKLNELYTEHGDYVRELLTVKHLYEDEDYIKQVNDILESTLKKDSMDGKFPYPVTKEGIRAFLTGDTSDDDCGYSDNDLLPQKRPLSALTSAVMNDDNSLLIYSKNKK